MTRKLNIDNGLQGWWTSTTGYNIIFAKAGVSCFYESEVQGSSSVFQMNTCAKNPRLRKYENRYATPYLNGRTKFNKQKKDERNCQRFKKTKEVQPNAPSQRIAPHLFFTNRTMRIRI